MFGFFIKKTFFDMWDNLLAVILLNIGFYGVMAAVLGSMYGMSAIYPVILPASSLVGLFVSNLIMISVAGMLIGVYSGAVSAMALKIADYEKPGFAAFFGALKATWKPSLIFGLIQGVLLGLILNAASVYLRNMDNLLNPLLFFVLFWIYLTWLMASQYFFALQSRFDKKPLKNIRKMFILFFDNPMFTILGLTIVSIFVFGLSVVLFLIIPGLTGILLLQAEALKLRLLKYDFLDANPKANRRKIPWKTLLATDRERVGVRTLKGMFFPWKE